MFYNDELIFLAVELKYCERCGELYVRRSGARTKLCSSCEVAELYMTTRPEVAIHACASVYKGAWSECIGTALSGLAQGVRQGAGGQQ